MYKEAVGDASDRGCWWTVNEHCSVRSAEPAERVASAPANHWISTADRQTDRPTHKPIPPALLFLTQVIPVNISYSGEDRRQQPNKMGHIQHFRSLDLNYPPRTEAPLDPTCPGQKPPWQKKSQIRLLNHVCKKLRLNTYDVIVFACIVSLAVR